VSRCMRVVFAAFLLSLILLTGCQRPVIDTEKIVRSDTDLPEIVGIIAGFGTTFAAFPDFLAMMRGAYAYFLRKETEKSVTAATGSKSRL